MSDETLERALRRAVILVALLNFAYFFVEFAVARVIGSVSLFADSVDFLEDASVNFLVLVALGWTAQRRAAFLSPAMTPLPISVSSRRPGSRCSGRRAGRISSSGSPSSR
jgi:hypothetical protein